MEYLVKSGNPARLASACLVVGVHADRRLSRTAQAIDQATEAALGRQLARAGFDGAAGKTQMLQELPGIAARRLLAVGLGPAGKLDAKTLRKALAAAGRVLAGASVADALFALTADPAGLPARATGRDLVIGIEDAAYRFDRL